MNKLNLKAAYRGLVTQLRKSLPYDEAMAQAVGGGFEAFGIIETGALRFYGLQPEHHLVDVGCGSGRLAIPLSRTHSGPYLGTDLVPELLAYAKSKCARKDWRFELVDGLKIPEVDGSADMVCFFSVLTHLLHEQSYLYLEEARRVLKPGGRIVFSFLEFALEGHWPEFIGTVEGARRDGTHPLNVFIERAAIRAWAKSLHLTVDEIRDGDDHFVPLTEPLTLPSGIVLTERVNLGQSVCVLSKPLEG